MNPSLVLYHKGKPVYQSQDSGLRPLIVCINACKDTYAFCRLYDKVIGLAAARLIVYSGMIASVTTPLASKAAVALLRENHIQIKADTIVDHILNKDKTGQCPMEELAEGMGTEAFYRELSQRMNSSNERPRRRASSCETP